MGTFSRLAPTPSGYLHIGNAWSFVITWLMVKRDSGKLLLRIDDSDSERVRNEYVEDILESLDWLGIDYDRGPRNWDELQSKYSQKNKGEIYNKFLTKLQERKLIYACRCSRNQISNWWKRKDLDKNVYPGTCKDLNYPLDRSSAWRMRLIKEPYFVVQDIMQENLTLPQELQGDFIIRKKNGEASYQLISVAEDVEEKINLIVRGSDLIESTALQYYLAGQLGLDSFLKIKFLHHGLILDSKGAKLSKSNGATSLKTLRNKGQGSSSLYRLFGKWLNLGDDIQNINALQKKFNPRNIPSTDIRLEKNWNQI